MLDFKQSKAPMKYDAKTGKITFIRKSSTLIPYALCAVAFIISPIGLSIVASIAILFIVIQLIIFNSKISPITSAETIMREGDCDKIKCNACYNTYFNTVLKRCAYMRADHKKPYSVNGSIDRKSITSLESFLQHKNILTKVKF